MRLVLSKSICMLEFGQEFVPTPDFEPLLRTLEPSLTVPIKGEGLPKGSRLLKAYVTTPKGPRRAVHLLAVADGTLFLLFYRDKNDSVGRNITIKNPAFRRQLHRHLDLLTQDLREGNVTILEMPA